MWMLGLGPHTYIYQHTHVNRPRRPLAPVLVDDEDGEELGAVVLRRAAVPQELHLLVVFFWCWFYS